MPSPAAVNAATVPPWRPNAPGLIALLPELTLSYLSGALRRRHHMEMGMIAFPRYWKKTWLRHQIFVKSHKLNESLLKLCLENIEMHH
jgi:hypothetical protein